jgi:hypothetical protein
MKYRDIDKAIKAAKKKIRVLGTAALNSNLEHFCGDFAEAYRQGVEEAQGEIVTRLMELKAELAAVGKTAPRNEARSCSNCSAAPATA